MAYCTYCGAEDHDCDSECRLFRDTSTEDSFGELWYEDDLCGGWFCARCGVDVKLCPLHNGSFLCRVCYDATGPSDAA